MSHDDDPELWHAINRLSSLIDTMHANGLFDRKPSKTSNYLNTAGKFDDYGVVKTGLLFTSSNKPKKKTLAISNTEYDTNIFTDKAKLVPLPKLTDPMNQENINITLYRKILLDLDKIKKKCEHNIGIIQDFFADQQYNQDMEKERKKIDEL